MTEKKEYQMPTLSEVKLAQEVAVLTNCIVSFAVGPFPGGFCITPDDRCYESSS